MKTLVSASLIALGLFVASVPASAATGQQTKMGECNKDAGDKKGAERKAFMKSCLSAKKSTPQSRMKTCNAEAKGKSGNERKAYMKDCLSK